MVVFEETNRGYEIDGNGNVTGAIKLEADEQAGDITKDGEYDGTSTAPYEINCIEDLVAFSKAINNNEISQTCYVILMRTLDFKSITSYGNYKATYSYDESLLAYIEDETSNTTLMELCTADLGFIPIGTSATSTTSRFKGNFDGQGYEIQNIYINTSGNAGLFGGVFLATVSNLGISGEITSTGSYAGGIIAEGASTIINCYNESDVTGKSSTGGIVGHGGWQAFSMQNCYNTGEILSINSYAGGLAGTFAGTIDNCYNLANVTSNSSYSAGVLGQSAGSVTITNCYNTGNVESISIQAAGIIASEYSTAIVNNCYNTGDILVTNDWTNYSYAKGIGGTTITNCYSSGDLSSNVECYVIGSGTVSNCYYYSSALTSSYAENDAIDVDGKTAEEIVELLNSYIDDTEDYPTDWNKWKVGDDGYPTFE